VVSECNSVGNVRRGDESGEVFTHAHIQPLVDGPGVGRARVRRRRVGRYRVDDHASNGPYRLSHGRATFPVRYAQVLDELHGHRV
jgi:hypothetical protein